MLFSKDLNTIIALLYCKMGKIKINQKSYEAKSVLISRNKNPIKSKDKENAIDKGDLKPEYKYVILVKLFSENDPHSSMELPSEEFEFENVSITSMENFEIINFLTLGSDLLINNVNDVEIILDNDTLLIINK